MVGQWWVRAKATAFVVFIRPLRSHRSSTLITLKNSMGKFNKKREMIKTLLPMTSFKQCYTKLDGRSKLRKRKNTTRIAIVRTVLLGIWHLSLRWRASTFQMNHSDIAWYPIRIHTDASRIPLNWFSSLYFLVFGVAFSFTIHSHISSLIT